MLNVETKSIYDSAGRKLRAAREQVGLTREACASLVGLKSGVAILRYENGQRKIPLHLIPAFAKLFGLEISYFFPDDGDAATHGDLDEGFHPPRRSIDEKQRKDSHFDVLLAYQLEDRPQVAAIAQKLRLRGLFPWFDAEQIAPGRRFQDEIWKAISVVNSVAVFIGRGESLRWERIEQLSLLQECVTRAIPLIPVLLPDAVGVPQDVSLLKQLIQVKFRESVDDDEAVDSLVWGITGIRPHSE